MDEQRCPVCEGRGFVPHGFYMHAAGQAFQSYGTGNETCRRCFGLGTIPMLSGDAERLASTIVVTGVVA